MKSNTRHARDWFEAPYNDNGASKKSSTSEDRTKMHIQQTVLADIGRRIIKLKIGGVTETAGMRKSGGPVRN